MKTGSSGIRVGKVGRKEEDRSHAVIAPQTPTPSFPRNHVLVEARTGISLYKLPCPLPLLDHLFSLDSAFHVVRDLVFNQLVHSDCKASWGLGRKDGNMGSFHKDGWIPAFAGMTGRLSQECGQDSTAVASRPLKARPGGAPSWIPPGVTSPPAAPGCASWRSPRLPVGRLRP